MSQAKTRNSLTETFDFPPEFAAACEQYLVYFAQFLADLGIDASVDLRHEAQQTLFSVTPKEGEEALHRIREALDAYLQIPTDPGFKGGAGGAGDIAVLQLRANVSFLESQVQLGRATIQAKDIAIEALSLTNYRLVEQLASRDAEDRDSRLLLAAEPKQKDTEAVITGIVSAKDLDVPGGVVHVAEIVRRLKRSVGL